MYFSTKVPKFPQFWFVKNEEQKPTGDFQFFMVSLSKTTMLGELAVFCINSI